MNGVVVADFLTEYVLVLTDGRDLSRMAKRQSAKGVDREIARVQRELARKEGELTQVVDDVESGVSPYRFGMKLAARLESTIADLNAELANLYALSGDTDTEYVSTPGLLRECWDQLSSDERRAAIKGVLDFIGKRVTIVKEGLSPNDTDRIRIEDI